MKLIIVLVILCSTLLVSVQSQQCGRQAGNRLCHDFQCCSSFGFCGTTRPWCGPGCQSMCWSGERSDHRCGASFGNPPCGERRCCSRFGFCGGGNEYCGTNCAYRCWTSFARGLALPRNLTANAVTDILTESVFDDMFSHRKDCPSQDFYSYNALLVAAESFPSFATTGDVSTRKRELAAFLALVSQATTGKWSDVEDPHGWGLCHINGTTSGNKYTSRGPIQLAHIVNYELAGQAIGVDLIKDPELVSTDAVVSFKTALWFWMDEHDNKPSCHDVVVNGKITRVPSNGVIADIFNFASELANGVTSSAGYYKRYCDMLEVPALEFARIQMPLEA